MRLSISIFLTLTILSMAGLAYVQQASLLQFIDENIRVMPAYLSALIIVAWVSFGSVILIPNTVLFMTSGSLFGFWWALAFNLIGFAIGSSLAFLIARYGLTGFVASRTQSMTQTFNQRFSNAGWRAVAVVRLTPIFPSFAVNYLLGITHVRFFDYLWASVVFTVSACVIATLFGDVSIALLLEGDLSPQVIVGGITLIVVLAMFIVLLLKRYAANVQ